MAQIKQVGVGRKTTGTIDGITYYVVLIFTAVKKLKPCDSNVSPYINILLIYSSI